MWVWRGSFLFACRLVNNVFLQAKDQMRIMKKKKSQLNSLFICARLKRSASFGLETLTEAASVLGCTVRAVLSYKLILTPKRSCRVQLLHPKRSISSCLGPPPALFPASFFFFLDSWAERKEMCIRLVCIRHRLSDSGPA